jgi:hypothetical protein
VEERIWRSDSQAFERIFHSRIGVQPRRRSRPLTRALCDFRLEHTFGQAAARFAEHYGFAILISAVRNATLKSGRRLPLVSI